MARHAPINPRDEWHAVCQSAAVTGCGMNGTARANHRLLQEVDEWHAVRG
jgi:hypothetical protein